MSFQLQNLLLIPRENFHFKISGLYISGWFSVPLKLSTLVRVQNLAKAYGSTFSYGFVYLPVHLFGVFKIFIGFNGFLGCLYVSIVLHPTIFVIYPQRVIGHKKWLGGIDRHRFAASPSNVDARIKIKGLLMKGFLFNRLLVNG